MVLLLVLGVFSLALFLEPNKIIQYRAMGPRVELNFLSRSGPVNSAQIGQSRPDSVLVLSHFQYRISKLIKLFHPGSTADEVRVLAVSQSILAFQFGDHGLFPTP